MSYEGRLVRFEVAPALEEEFLQRAAANVDGSRREPQNITFGLARSPEEEAPGGPGIFYVWEEFSGDGAFAHHHATAHFQTFRTWLQAQQETGAIVVRRLATRPLLRD